MDNEQELLEPIKYFDYELKYKHQDNVEAYFDELAKQSGVDVEANALTCKEYYSLVNRLTASQKKLDSSKGLRVFLIVMTVLSFIIGTILIIVSIYKKDLLKILLPIGIVLILAGVGLIVINSIRVANRISTLNNLISKLKKLSGEKLAEANQQMAALNALYDWNIPSTLVNKTTPIIHLDKNATVERYSYLVQNYGWKENNPDNVSAIFVQSGSILDNPFLYERDYIQVMRPHTYVGSIVISWTTTSTDSKGHTTIHHHTQTLTAEVVRPAASYFLDTALIYANEAAPKLSFHRGPTGASGMSEDKLEKEVSKFAKQLEKKSEKDIDKSFTALGNEKFEYLFRALNRNNEVEFRLLFTPLAQKNLCDLILNSKPYGDDFSFDKKDMINIIHSGHAQNLSFDGNPYHFRTFDFNKARENFIKYNMNYFQGLYYDFAPLLSIPLYQQHKDYDIREKPKYKGSVTLHEAEVLANFMEPNIFKPDLCDTNLILKATLSSCKGNVNIFDITSHGFQKVPMVEYVNKLGRDGHMHTIPVHYFEYEPVEKVSQTVVIEVGGNKQIYDQNRDAIMQLISNYSMSSDIIYQRGLLSFPLKEGITTINGEEITKLFKTKEA